MDKTADAVIIGGGIMGASIGHFLSKKGFGKIVLLEKRTLAAVSTGYSAAGIRTFYSNPLTVKLAVRAVEMFENDRQELGGDSGFRRTGYVNFFGEPAVSQGRQVLEMERANGAVVEDLSSEDLRVRFPYLNLEGVVAGVFEPRSGYADPVRTTRSLVESAKPWGLVAYEGTGATGIRLKDGRVTGVESEQGTIDTPVVVNAAGPWGRQVGLWAGLNYSIRWSRESDLVLSRPPDVDPLPLIGDPNLRIYLRPQGEDKVVAGLGGPKEVEPLDIDDHDNDLDPKMRQRIERPLFERVPALKSAKYVHGWASVYTISDDWHPIVGAEADVEGYYAFFAGSGHGFKLAPPIGEALAHVIAGDTPKIDIHGLRPSRFMEGETLTSVWGNTNRA